MYVSAAISGFLTHLKDNILSNFDLLDVFVYDENLDFRGRASQYIAREGIFQQEEGKTPKDWIFIIWNRGSLQTNDTSHNRIMNITVGVNDPERIDSEVLSRMAKLDIEVKIVTNNIEIAETIEEWLHVLSGEFIKFEADYGSTLGIMECSADADTSTSFEKEDLNEVGPVISIGTTSTISFPIFLNVESSVIIEEIHSKIYDSLKVKEGNLIGRIDIP